MVLRGVQTSHALQHVCAALPRGESNDGSAGAGSGSDSLRNGKAWACSRCTYDNSLAKQFCTICDTRRADVEPSCDAHAFETHIRGTTQGLKITQLAHKALLTFRNGSHGFQASFHEQNLSPVRRGTSKLIRNWHFAGCISHESDLHAGMQSKIGRAHV